MQERQLIAPDLTKTPRRPALWASGALPQRDLRRLSGDSMKTIFTDGHQPNG